MGRASILFAIALGLMPLLDPSAAGAAERGSADAARESPRNFVLILCDNLGYGDIGCFGSMEHRTPHLDRMAAEGRRFTTFYSTSGVCTPSRASLLTGCYPRRVNLHVDEHGGAVLRPVSSRGLHPDEITIAEVLKERGYATACIGKWHVGDQPEFLPTRQGFDEYFGIPYSDDMTPRPGRPWPPLPLMRGEQVIEAPADRQTLTRRYTSEAIRFIERNHERPFFLYLPHAMPGSTNRPFASEAFRGRSANGPYGDSVEELDWSTGEILAALDRLNLDEQTLVVWTSDNGAPRRSPPQGSNAPLGGWGYTTREGGMRVPMIARWPGRIPAGSTCDELATMMDLLPTFAALSRSRLPGGTDGRSDSASAGSPGRQAGVDDAPGPARQAGPTRKPPQDRIIDGHDIRPLLFAEPDARSPYRAFYYYHLDQLQAVRAGRWKLFLELENRRTDLRDGRTAVAAELYDLQADPGETMNVASEHGDVVARLAALANEARHDLGDGAQSGRNQRPAGTVEDPQPRVWTESRP